MCMNDYKSDFQVYLSNLNQREIRGNGQSTNSREAKACRKSGLQKQNANGGFREGPHFGFQVLGIHCSLFFVSKVGNPERHSELRGQKSAFPSM